MDAGNALRAAQLLAQIPFVDLPERAPTPNQGYFQGRFTDGYTFPDLLSNKMLLAATSPVFPYGFQDPVLGITLPGGRPPGANLNFAYGGAQAVHGTESVPSLQQQVDTYLGHEPGDPNALYSITIGGNDVRELVPNAGAVASADVAATKLNAAASKIVEDVAQLYAAGARHVIVTGIPNVGLLPNYIGSADEAARRSTATVYSKLLDDMLTTKLAGLAAPAGGELRFESLIGFAGQLLANPAAYHLANLTQARTVAQAGALDPTGTSGFLFFDDVHPSAQVHALFAASILDSYRPPSQRLELQAQNGAPLVSTIGAVGETDVFHVSLTAGQTYAFDLLGISSASGTLADPRLSLLDGAAMVAGDDDSGLGLDAHLSFVAPHTGVFTLHAAGVGVTVGGYRLEALGAGSDLLLTGRLLGSDENVVGSAGSDVITAEAGANVLAGAAGADTLTGGASIDTVNGNAGDDLVLGGAGGDLLFGGRDNDSVFGGDGADTVSGDLGGDSLNGNAGADVLLGGAGADTLRGGQGADLLLGGDGNDWLSGDRGDDTLAGGAGADLFYAFPGAGVERILDFNRAEGDRVQIQAGTPYATAQVGPDVVVTFEGGEVVLVGVQASALGADWIV